MATWTLLISTNNGPAYLLRNDGGNRNHWLSVRLAGTQVEPRWHRRGGARGKRRRGKQWNMVRSGSSYCSQSDLALTFGLGKDSAANLEVIWPSGTHQRFQNIAANQRVLIDESKGLAQMR